MNESKLFIDQIIKAIRSVVGDKYAALHEPIFSGNEYLYLRECLDSNFVSSVGEFVNKFESALEKYTGAKYAVAVVNGTAALHVSLRLAGVMSNHEVLVPALTFIAPVNAITYCNAIPHFVDCEESTLGIDPLKLREYLCTITEQRSGYCINKITGRVIKVLLPIHTFGHPVDIDGLISLAHDFNLSIVEDAAESLGSYYHGQHTGTFGLLGTLSFNGNKTITTGGGGAILTNDLELARHAKHLTTTAKLPHPWEFCHNEIGYNYRLPNLNAALGCAQLENLDSMLVGQRNLFQRYQSAFSSIKGLSLIIEPNMCRSNYWLQTVLLDKDFSNLRDLILKSTNEIGLITRPVWKLMNELTMFENCPKMDLSVAKSLSERLINIPSSASL